MAINKNIFKAYDIRGIYPQELNEATVEKIAQVFASHFKTKFVAIGHDARLSSPKLAQAVKQGLKKAGVAIFDLGLCSTDSLYFAVGKNNYDGGIMVTASHNPKQYNGLKFCRQRAISLNYNSGLKIISKITQNKQLKSSTKASSLKKIFISKDYVRFVLKSVNPRKIRPLRLVIDAGNGVGGLAIDPLLKKLPLRIKRLNWLPDGRFPAHLPNPSLPANNRELIKEIKRIKADCGVAFDGDADRIVFFDEIGRPLSGSETMLLILSQILPQKDSQTILYSSTVSRAVPELIKKYHGRAIRTPAGHSIIKPLMRKYRAEFAGEGSGHFYWQKNYYAESGLLTFVQVMKILSQVNLPLSRMVKDINPYYQSSEINLKINNPHQLIKKIAHYFRTAKIDQLDGLTVVYPDWWFNLRISNTEPLIRLNIEAKNAKLLKEKQKLLKKLLSTKRA